MSVIDQFPDDYLVEVVALRGGGRDAKGNPTPEERIPLTGCLLAKRATSEPTDRSDMTSSSGTLYRRPGFKFLSTDRIEVPDGAFIPAGEWRIEGDPVLWPVGGWEVPLERG